MEGYSYANPRTCAPGVSPVRGFAGFGRWARKSRKPDGRNRRNPQIGTYLSSADEIRAQPPVPAVPHGQQPRDRHANPRSRTGTAAGTRRWARICAAWVRYARICRFPHRSTPPRARQPADGNTSPTSRHHPTTATREYAHISTAPAEYASNRRFLRRRANRNLEIRCYLWVPAPRGEVSAPGPKTRAPPSLPTAEIHKG